MKASFVRFCKKKLTGWNVFDEYNKLFYKKGGITFYSKDPNQFTYFQGWKYDIVSEAEYGMGLIQDWLGMEWE